MYRGVDDPDAEFEQQLRGFWPGEATPASQTR
jgi:hypothetical protein